MVMNKQKGNMYGFVTHTWNPIKGKCSHDCSYCYMKVYKQKELHLAEKELKDNLGQDNFIFVGSSTDMFANDVPRDWIKKVLAQCRNYPGNTYLFQTKNPSRYWLFNIEYPPKTIFGITVESNRSLRGYSKAQSSQARVSNMQEWFMKRKMITIEPIIDFDLMEMIDIIKEVRPEFVNIGADSKGHNLPEPSEEKIKRLIEELRKFTKVNLKDNLKRLGDFTPNGYLPSPDNS